MLDTAPPSTPNSASGNLNGRRPRGLLRRGLDRSGMWSDEVMGEDYAAKQRRRTPHLRVAGVIVLVHVVVVSALAYGLRPKARPMFPEPYRPLPPLAIRIIPEPPPPVPPRRHPCVRSWSCRWFRSFPPRSSGVITGSVSRNCSENDTGGLIFSVRTGQITVMKCVAGQKHGPIRQRI